jgi:hypothetical protein
VAYEDMGPDDVRQACYRLCGALGWASPNWPSVADLEYLVTVARERSELLTKAIAQSDAALAALQKSNS